MPSHSHICQIAPDDRLRLNDVLAIEDDVLRAAEDASPRNPVSTRCFYVLRFVKGNVWQLHNARLCKCIGITANMSLLKYRYIYKYMIVLTYCGTLCLIMLITMLKHQWNRLAHIAVYQNPSHVSANRFMSNPDGR